MLNLYLKKYAIILVSGGQMNEISKKIDKQCTFLWQISILSIQYLMQPKTTINKTQLYDVIAVKQMSRP